jgi:hypothetical protein
MDYPKTIFLDIDGCVLKHASGVRSNIEAPPTLLPGVLEKLTEWDAKGYKIVLTTGRRESERSITEKHLSQLGVFYDCLLMSLPRGQRVVINDAKPDHTGELTAWGVTIERDAGLAGVCV